MNGARILAYVTGTVDQELLLRNEYLAAENRILQLKGRLQRSNAERAKLGEIARRVGRRVLGKVANAAHWASNKSGSAPGGFSWRVDREDARRCAGALRCRESGPGSARERGAQYPCGSRDQGIFRELSQPSRRSPLTMDCCIVRAATRLPRSDICSLICS